MSKIQEDYRAFYLAIGRRDTALREARCISMVEAGAMIGASKSFVNSFKRAQFAISTERLMQLSKAYQCPLSQFFPSPEEVINVVSV